MKTKIELDNIQSLVDPLCHKLATTALDYAQDLNDTLDIPEEIESTVLISGLAKTLGGIIGQNFSPENVNRVVDETAEMLKAWAKSYHEFEKEKLKK